IDLVHVISADLDEVGELFTARAAPGRPEIYQHRFAFRFQQIFEPVLVDLRDLWRSGRLGLTREAEKGQKAKDKDRTDCSHNSVGRPSWALGRLLATLVHTRVSARCGPIATLVHTRVSARCGPIATIVHTRVSARGE